MLADPSRKVLLGLVLAALGSTQAACSAIVQPDPGRLGGIDGGGGGGTDTGVVGIDTGVVGTDTGPLPDAAIDTGPMVTPDAGTDTGPTCPPSCDDGVACTNDRCEGAGCVHEPDDALCPGERCSATLGCVAIVCTTDEDCNDGNRCNGAERCDPSGGTPTGCVAGAPPDCNDGVSCTDDHCAPDRGCFHDLFNARCDDGVACTTDVCTGTSGPTGCEYRLDDTACNGVCEMGGRCTMRGCMGSVPRVCPSDGNACTVESCDPTAGCASTALDADGDGYPAMRVVTGGTTTMCTGGTDCDDGRMGVNPGATEVCGNGIDDDCNPATSDVCAGSTGDTCADALPITITGGTGSATVMLGPLRNDYATSCDGGTMGHDAVFYFDVTTTSDVRIETSGAVDTILAAATTCSGDAFRNRCNDDRNRDTDTTSRIWVRPVTVPSGGRVRVYVLVDEYGSGDTDPVTVTVTLSTPVTPNACPSATVARPLDISGGGTVLGNLGVGGGVVGGERGSCQPAAFVAPEAIFRIEEPDRTLNSIIASTPGFVPDLYVRYGGCAAGTELACTRGTSSGGSGGTASLSMVTGTTTSQLFYVMLDNFPVTGGEYQLTYDP